ncbi:MAG: hypothetical protein KY439_07160 [Actinobacteria bacterium]|nr:hypothetical protein [Actinomycetota bacterium]
MLNTNRSESGNLIIATGVLMVLTLLGLGMIARTVSSQKQVRASQDFNAGLAAADAGIADALFQLDQLPQNASATTFTKTNEAVPGGSGGRFSYTATPLDDNRYRIRSSGTVNGVQHDVIADAKRRRRFDYVFYGRSEIKVNGNCKEFPGPIGSSGTIIGTGTTAGNCIPLAECFLRDNGDLPTPSAGCGDQVSSRNPNGRRLHETNIKPPVALPVPPPSLTDLGCPAVGGIITGTLNGQGGTGYYNCTSSVALRGTITVVNGPVMLYVTGGTVSVAGCGSCGTPIFNDGGDAINFQLYVGNASTITFPTGSRVFAGIYAPTSKVSVPPNVTFKGGIVADEVTINGAPNLGVLDPTLDRLTIESWKLFNYREVPSTCTTNC